MNGGDPLPYRASLADYQRQADLLFKALQSADEAARWRLKLMHPRFRNRSQTEFGQESLTIADAQSVVARDYGFDSWISLAEFVEIVSQEGPVERFETAVEAVVAGDVALLKSMLRADPKLSRARSMRRHRATLLHYVSANGVETGRQKTPRTAVAIVKLLLEAGADVDALADMYDQKCTTLNLLVSSCHPAEAGLQTALAESLVDYGAALDGADQAGTSPLLMALAFGYHDTAQMLARRAAPLISLEAAAGLGQLEVAERLLAAADGRSRHIAMALAAQHGHTALVRLLLDAGEDPNRFNPPGFHPHSTPLHQAVLSNHSDVVQLLVARGARRDVRDSIYDGTPFDWAVHSGHVNLAPFLRDQGDTESAKGDK
ncbi:MAG: ankyrin repeat domain-containing protein [Planctomycetales bacterium]